MELINVLNQGRLQEMNITYEVFSKINSTDLKTFLESHFNVKFDNITDFNISSTALPIVSENTETKSRPKRAIPLIPILSAIAGTALGATTTMLASIIQNVYIDNDWVAHQYIQQGKRERWNNKSTEEVLKCWNLECIINA